MRLCGISSRFQLLSPCTGQVTHALLTRPPLASLPKEIRSFDLHVLGTPPAFILSQDQTLKKKMSDARIKTTGLSFLSYCCFRFSNFRSSFHGSDVLTSTKPQTRMKFKGSYRAGHLENLRFPRSLASPNVSVPSCASECKHPSPPYEPDTLVSA